MNWHRHHHLRILVEWRCGGFFVDALLFLPSLLFFLLQMLSSRCAVCTEDAGLFHLSPPSPILYALLHCWRSRQPNTKSQQGKTLPPSGRSPKLHQGYQGALNYQWDVTMQNTVDLGKQLDNIYIANTCKCVIPEQNVREKKHWEEKKAQI